MPCNLLKISRADSFVMRRSPVRVREVALKSKFIVTICKRVNYSDIVCAFIVFILNCYEFNIHVLHSFCPAFTCIRGNFWVTFLQKHSIKRQNRLQRYNKFIK